MTSIVVTGASGFIGQATVAALARAGAEAIAAARRPLSAPPSVRMMLVRDYAELAVPVGASLIHLAEEAVIGEANQAGAEHEAASTRTLASLLAKGFAHIVYASSGQVYDRTQAPPYRPDAQVAAADPYSRAKLANEAQVLAAGGCVLRLGNIYGPGMQRRTLTMTLLSQIPGAGPLRLWDASSVRDFVWVDDAAAAFAQAALQHATGIHNVGTGSGVSAGELAQLALEIAQESHRPVIASGAPQAGSSAAIVLDPQSAAAAFDWRATTSLREGLKRMLGEGAPG